MDTDNVSMETETVSIEDLGLTSEQLEGVGFLAEFTKRMVLIALPEQKTPAGASNLIKEVYRVTDDVMSGSFKNGTKSPCKKGCYWCCYLRVKVTPLEVMGILDYLRSHLKPGEISGLRQRLVRADEITRGMDGIQRVRAKMTCPLLLDGICLTYPVRPIACRVYHSLNLSDCEVLLVKDGGRVTIRQSVFGLSMGINAGLIDGLRKVGLQTRLLELTTGLRIAMEEPGTGLMKRWLSGEPAFVGAEIESAKKIEGSYRALVEELGEAQR
jgi:Fe-S-cluster containining protein